MVTITYGQGNLWDFEPNFLWTQTTYTATSNGTTTTTINTTHTEGDDTWNGYFIHYLTGSNAGESKEITDFDAGTDTLTHDAFTNATASGDTYWLSKFTLVEDGNTLAVPTSNVGDNLFLNCTATGGNATAYITNVTNLGLSTTIYKKVLVRYKTASNAQAKVVAEYSDASTDTVLAATTSTTWKIASFTLDTAKTLDHLRFHCDTGTGYVYYDFALVYQGEFTFPNCISIDGELPTRHAELEVSSRFTDITQPLGSRNTPINIHCDFTRGTWKRTSDRYGNADVINGQVFYDIAYHSGTEPWQWIDTEREQFKVYLDTCRFNRAADANSLTDSMDLTFKEGRLSDAGNSTERYTSRWGIDL